MLIKKYFPLLLIFVTISIFSLLVWSMDKGFDLADEGYYIAGYSNLIEYRFGLSLFHFFTLNTLSKIGSGLIFFRSVRLFITIIGSVFLALSLYSWLKKFNFIKSGEHTYSRLTFSFISLIGGLLSYSFGPQTLSYNHYTFFFGNIFLGLLFLTFNYAKSRNTLLIISAVTGFFLGFEIFMKVPTAILLLFLFICVQFILIKQLRLNVIINILLVIVASIISFSVVSFPNSPLLIFQEYVMEIKTNAKYTSHDVMTVLNNYKLGFVDIWSFHFSKFVPILSFIILVHFVFRNNRLSLIKNNEKYIYFLLICFLIFQLYVGGYFMGGLKHRATISVLYTIALFLCSLFFLFHYERVNWKFLSDYFIEKIFVISSLILFPLICSFGTNNFLHVQILLFLNTWFLLMYLIFRYIIFKKSKYSFAVFLLLLTITLKSANDIYESVVLDPYGIKGPLWKQTEALKIYNSNEIIYVDKEMKNKLDLIQNSILNSNIDVFFTSWEFDGLSYIFNKKLIGSGTYEITRKSKQYVCHSYNKSTIKEKGKICYILNASANNCNIVDCFRYKMKIAKMSAIPWNYFGSDSVILYEGSILKKL